MSPDKKKPETSRPNLEAVDDLVLFLAEHTDVSPNQAKELIRKHGSDRKKLFEEAKNFKAEG